MDSAEFEVKLTDKVSGPAGKATGGAKELSSALGEIKSATVEVTVKQTKLDRALKAAQLVHYGASAVEIGKRVWDSAGGFDGMRNAAKRAGAALANFGRSALQAGKKVAPFAIGGAGIYGLAKVASTVAVPALSATAIGIAGVTAAAAAATIGIGILTAKLASMAAGKVVDFATFGQDSKFAMANLAKHGADANKMFAHATTLAAEYGLNVEKTTHSWSKFLALQFAPREADKMIKMGADLQALGTSAEQVEGVFMALGQIKSKGKLQAEEMLQLAERGISAALVYEELGKILSKTPDQVRKIQEAGKLDADTGLLGIENAINRKLGQKELGESGKRFADQTITGVTNRIKARASLIGTALGERVAPSLQRLADKVLVIFDRFAGSDRAAQIIDKIGLAFDRIGDIAIAVAPLIESLMGGFSDRALESLGGLNTAIGGFAGADGAAAAQTFRDIGKGIADIAIYGGKAIAVAGAVVGALAVLEAKVGGVFPTLIGAFSNPIGAISDSVIAKITELVPKAIQLGTDFVKGLADGIRAGIMYPVNAITDVGNSVVAKIRGVWDSHSPSRVAGSIGFGFDQGLGVGLYAGAGIPVAAAESVAFGTVRAASDVMTSRPAFASGPMLESHRLPELAYQQSAASGTGSGRSVSFGDIVVHTSATDADGTARAVRRELESYFRQLEMEGG